MRHWRGDWKQPGIIATSSTGAMHSPDKVAESGRLNERQPKDFRRLLEQFAASETLPCEGVVYLWALDTPSIDDLGFAQLKSGSRDHVSGSLGHLAGA